MKLTPEARKTAVEDLTDTLVMAGLATHAKRWAAELVDRPGADILIAPGVILRRSVCDCAEDCDPFTAAARAAVASR